MKQLLLVCATGVLCAPASADYLAVTFFGGELWRIDESTGSSTQIGELGGSWVSNAMARSADGRYFITAERFNSGDAWLFEIDPETGGSTALFSTGLSGVRSMAFAPDGSLRMSEYDGSDSRIWSVDLGTQAVTNPISVLTIFQGLAIDAMGQGYIASPGILNRIDLTTGAVSPFSGASGIGGVQALEINGVGDLIGLGSDLGPPDSRLWTYDLATGATTSFVSLERRDYRGVAWIPAPGAPAFLGVVLMVGARRRRPRA